LTCSAYSAIWSGDEIFELADAVQP
jgi:hypothetical protein